MVSATDIRRAREKTRESQAEFAKRFGVDQSTIHRWESDGPPASGPAARGIKLVIDEIDEAPEPARAN